jgi:putative tryptophan/tyrosine transport system substrate-binding protein
MNRPPSPLTMLFSRHTRRREFIAGLGSAVALPLAARAQQPDRMRRVGVLSYGFDPNGALQRFVRDYLERVGWSEGRNLRLDFRFGDGEVGKTSAFAADWCSSGPM